MLACLRYDICASANSRNDEAKALRIPTLLEKEALAIFLDIPEDDREVYENVKQALVRVFQPPEARFIALHEFETRKILPGESLQEFLYSIKQLLRKAVPGMEEDSREQLLLHRFLSGVPENLSRSVRTSQDITCVGEALKKVKLLMIYQNSDSLIAPVRPAVSENRDNNLRLDRMEEKLNMLLTSLEDQKDEKRGKIMVEHKGSNQAAPIRCYRCQHVGHMARECRRTGIICYGCQKIGHVRRNCPLNSNRSIGRATGRPTYQFGPNEYKSTVCCTASYGNSDSEYSVSVGIIIGGIKVTSLLDFGSSTSLIVLEVVEMIGKEIDTRHFKRLVSATGNQLCVIGKVILPVKIGESFQDHEFTVVSKLVIPVILGIISLARMRFV